uniref:hypothetical protein n=1 Tax=Skeletonema subsalsum TaxID=216763 RepID=UPI001D11E343|nr:hypothetical protein LKZ01_mgp39 [Skeletonema subsalsum]UBA16186.1 hypothetical protein [Skeletonema subsalsum]
MLEAIADNFRADESNEDWFNNSGSNNFKKEIHKLFDIESNNLGTSLLHDCPLDNLLKKFVCHFFNFINNWGLWIENCWLSIFSGFLKILIHTNTNWYCCITIVKIVFSFKRIFKKFKQS